MPINVTCECGKKFRAKVEHAGKTTKCPNCSRPLTIPTDDQTKPEKEPSESPRPRSRFIVFMSYRRKDSEGFVGRIYDDLVEEFGRKNVFKDIDSIPLGENFKEVIDENVAKCGALLALIGETWVTCKDEQGRRRLDNPDDFVRLEIESAIHREIPIIPLLLLGSQAPSPDTLPSSIQELALRNGTPLRGDPDYHADMARVIKSLNNIKKNWTRSQSTTRNLRTKTKATLAGVMLAVALTAFVIYSFLTQTVIVPNVVGTSTELAIQELERVGLVVGNIQRKQGNSPGTILEQSPASGAEVARQTRVNLVQAAGITVPNVVGIKLEKAKAELVRAGLVVGNIKRKRGDSPGTILEQSPTAGAEVTRQSRVNLVQAAGITVPNVVRLTMEEAATKLESVGLTVGDKTREVVQDQRLFGTILEQSPAAGAEVTQHTRVNLVQAAGITVPNVIGLPMKEAATKLAGVDLSVGERRELVQDNQLFGTILEQTPVAGTEVARQTQVNLVQAVGIPVPNVIGLTIEEARAKLEKVRLSIGNKTTKPRQILQSSGRVLEQTPVAGTEVARQTAVNLVEASELPGHFRIFEILKPLGTRPKGITSVQWEKHFTDVLERIKRESGKNSYTVHFEVSDVFTDSARGRFLAPEISRRAFPEIEHMVLSDNLKLGRLFNKKTIQQMKRGDTIIVKGKLKLMFHVSDKNRDENEDVFWIKLSGRAAFDVGLTAVSGELSRTR